jgi:chromosome segregation ATPase
MDAPSLRRGVFGYSRKSVQELIADKDVTIIRLSREARDADARMAELAAELERTRHEISAQAELAAELERTRRDISDKVEQIEAAEQTTDELRRELEAIRAARDEQTAIAGSPSTAEEITEILDATDRALSRLVDGARRSAERELRETERARDELREEIDRLSEWRDRLIPLTEEVRRSLDDAQAQTSALAARLTELERAAAGPGEPTPADWSVIRIDDEDETVPPMPAVEPSPWGDPDRAARTAG